MGTIMHIDPALSFAEETADARLFFANYTSGLLAVNSTLLIYAGLGLVGLAALVAGFFYLANVSASSSGYGSGYQYYRGFREDSESGTTGSSILTLLSVASDIYSKLNYDDVDCQKKIICEFMEEPEMFGQGGSRVKTGVQWAASWLEPLGFGIVDQISEAATLDEEGKCEQRYKQCEKISLKETFDQKSEEVRKVEADLAGQEEEKESAEEEYEYYYEK